MTPFLESHDFCLTPLSPIHIGTGAEIDWTTSFIDGDDLVLFDPFRAGFSDTALRELSKLVEEADAGRALLGLQQFFLREKRALSRARTGAIAILPGLAREMAEAAGYFRQWREGHGGDVNALAVSRGSTNGREAVSIIPGSSLKGALRTAWLDGQKLVMKEQYLDETAMMPGRFYTDPFRLVLVEDSVATKQGLSTVMLATNYNRRERERGKAVAVRIEAATPFVAGGFRGALRRRDLSNWSTTSPAPSLAEVLKTCSRFHKKLFQDQLRDMREAETVDPGWLDGMQSLIRCSEPVFETGRAALIRLGKFGTAESKTMSAPGARQVKISQHEYRDRGTTFWLGGDAQGRTLLPFGWALLELAPEPGQFVRDWCDAQAEALPVFRYRPIVEPEPEPEPPPAVTRVLIVSTPNTVAEKRMAALEADLDAAVGTGPYVLGAGLGRGVRSAINEAVKGWSKPEKELLARLIEEKARPILKLKAYEAAELTQKLAWLKR